MQPTKPTESPRQVDLGCGALLSRLVVPIKLGQSDDRGLAIARRLAERWTLPLHLRPLIHHEADTIDLTDDHLDPVVTLADELMPGDLVVIGTNQQEVGHPAMSFAQALSHEWDGPIVMVGPNAKLDVSLDGDVVAALDGSSLAPRGMRTVALFAAALGSRLGFVRVVSPGAITGTQRLGARRESAAEAAYAIDLTEPIDLRDVSWTVIHTDDAASALADFVDRHDAAFLAITSPGMFALIRPRFGSICMATVQASPRPVLVTRPADF